MMVMLYDLPSINWAGVNPSQQLDWRSVIDGMFAKGILDTANKTNSNETIRSGALQLMVYIIGSYQDFPQ